MINFYLLLLLVFLISEFALSTIADLFNIHHFHGELPEEFRGIYDPQKYQQALRYQEDQTRFMLYKRFATLAFLLFLIFSHAFQLIDQMARSRGYGQIGTGLIFVGLLGALNWLFQLPFSIYDTFVIEERYGFNRTTPKTFVLDTVKSGILSVLLGAPLFAGLIYFFERMGPLAWFYSWVVFTVFQLGLSFLAPVIILPLFNRFNPLPEGELKSSIQNYAHQQNFKLQDVFTMDSSKRSTKTNAFFTGFGKFRRLVLFDTLIEKQTVEELVSIFAHEVGHYKMKHILKSTLLSILLSGMMFYGLSIFMNNTTLFQAFGMEQVSIYASMILIGFLYTPVLRLLSVFAHSLSRKFEFEADHYSLQSYPKPETLVSALKKLSMDNLSHLTPHPLKVILDYTHPPVLERIRAIRSSRS